jgi:hypothetical protein
MEGLEPAPGTILSLEKYREDMPYRIDQFPNKGWWCVMNIYNTKCILSSQSSCSSHSIASMCPDNFLICFKAPANQYLSQYLEL